MIRDLVILGAGGLAREVAFVVEEVNSRTETWNMIGFVESDGTRAGEAVGKYSVLCGEEELHGRGVAAVIGIGTPGVI